MVHIKPNRMTKEQFTTWLKAVDADNDNQISQKELEYALRTLGVSWVTIRAWFAVARSDLNHNRVVDGKKEIEKLIAHAQKHWGIVITDY